MTDGKKLILCVDDDPDVLDMLKMVMEAGGYAVKTAACAADGLRAYKAQKPDLVIVDLMMEEIDSGTNLVRDIRAADANAPSIFMLSSVGDNLAISADYASLGLAGVLQKPIDPAALIKTLQTKLS